jgi:hypothetical protein
MDRFLFTLLATMVISEEDLRFTHVYKQGDDTSCGVAVTASLLNTYPTMNRLMPHNGQLLTIPCPFRPATPPPRSLSTYI